MGAPKQQAGGDGQASEGARALGADDGRAARALVEAARPLRSEATFRKRLAVLREILGVDAVAILTHREPALPLFWLAAAPDGGAGECRLSAALLSGALGHADPGSVAFDLTPEPAPGAPLLLLFPIAVEGRGHGVVGFQLGAKTSRPEEEDTLFAALAHLLGVTLREADRTRAQARRASQLRASARRAAEIDSLTGLANYARVQSELTRELLRSRRSWHELALVMIDIDGFKSVNDTFGHAAGDRMLRLVAETLTGGTRASDRVGRLGGDEFALLLPETDVDGAQVVCGHILAALGLLRSESVSISLSMGIAAYPAHGESAEALSAHADIAMYLAKRAGGNRALVWYPEMERMWRTSRPA